MNEIHGFKYFSSNQYEMLFTEESQCYDFAKSYLLLKNEKNDLIGFLSVTINKNFKDLKFLEPLSESNYLKNNIINKSISINSISICNQFKQKGYTKYLYDALFQLAKKENLIVLRNYYDLSDMGIVFLKNKDFEDNINLISLGRNNDDKEFYYGKFRDYFNNQFSDSFKYVKNLFCGEENISYFLTIQKSLNQIDKFFYKKFINKNLKNDNFIQVFNYFIKKVDEILLQKTNYDSKNLLVYFREKEINKVFEKMKEKFGLLNNEDLNNLKEDIEKEIKNITKLTKNKKYIDR